MRLPFRIRLLNLLPVALLGVAALSAFAGQPLPPATPAGASIPPAVVDARPPVLLLHNRPLPGGGPLLPLDGKKLKRILVAGPGASDLQPSPGSGTARARPAPVIAALRERAKVDGFLVVQDPWIRASFAPVDGCAFTPDEKSPGSFGLKGEYFTNPNLEGHPAVRMDESLCMFADAKIPDKLVKLDGFSVRWTGFLRPPATGKYRIALRGEGKTRVWIKDRLVYDGWDKDPRKGGVGEFTNVPELTQGESCPIRLEYRNSGSLNLALHWMSFAKKEFSEFKNFDLLLLFSAPQAPVQPPQTASGSGETAPLMDQFFAAAQAVNPAAILIIPMDGETPAKGLLEPFPAALRVRADQGGALLGELFQGQAKKILP